MLLLSFGGPEGPTQVMPFLRMVTAGRQVPAERLAEVAEHYRAFGGRSPINDQCRSLLRALRTELDEHDLPLPLYWGNRNWHPLLADTVAAMTADGVRRALVFATSAYSSYSTCRQYREDLTEARATVPGAPELVKLRPFFNHPGFVEAVADRLASTLADLPGPQRAAARLVFTAHSIPCAMAATSDYEIQLAESARLVVERLAEQAGHVTGTSRPGSGDPARPWDLVFQSRSGPPQVPWLEPDVDVHLRALADAGTEVVVLVPIGFVSDNMEVLYDLDARAMGTAAELGLTVVRAPTVGTHPRFVTMIRELVRERALDRPRRHVGLLPPRPDDCAADCCPAPRCRPRTV